MTPTLRAAAVALATLLCACGGGSGESVTTESTGPTSTAFHDNDGAGPRPISGSIVPLEIEAFPRPAEQACADNTVEIDVAMGESIAAALTAAESGTSINVAPGTYTEPDEYYALEMRMDNVCLRSTGGQVVLEAGDDQGYGIVVTADEVVIEGFTLRGFEIGIAIDGREGETQRMVTIERSSIEAPQGEYREGIVVFAEPTGSEAVLDGLLVRNVAVSGVDQGITCNAGPCEHVWVEGASIVGRSGSGGSGADAFAIEEGRQIVVSNTTVAQVAADGIDAKANDVVVIGCRILDVARNGVKLWRGGDVINTIIDGTGGDASLVGEEPGTYRYLHTLVAHHAVGETAYVATWSYDDRASNITIEIVNSVFHENTHGGFFVPDGAMLSIRNTIFSGPPDHKLVDIGETAEYLFGDLAAFEQAGHGVGNLMTDPLFVDTVARDYATQSASPARDAAERIDALELDALGHARVRGSAPDIGPIES